MARKQTNAPDRDPGSEAVSEQLNQEGDKSDDYLDVADADPLSEDVLKGEGESEGTSDVMSEDEVRALFTFDPLASQEDEEEEEDDGKAGQETTEARSPEGGREESQPGKDDKKPPESEGQDETARELERVKSELARMERELQAERSAREAKPPESEADRQRRAEQEQQEELQEFGRLYSWEIPREFSDALVSEDASERGRAISKLLGAMGAAVHRNVRQELKTGLKAVVDGLPNVVDRQVQHHRRDIDIATDFYGNYPQLNKPEIKQYVPQVAQEVMREMGANAWSSEVRDRTAKRLVERLSSSLGVDLSRLLTKENQAAPTTGANGSTPRRPPRAMSSGSRGTPSTPLSRLQQDIMDTLG